MPATAPGGRHKDPVVGAAVLALWLLLALLPRPFIKIPPLSFASLFQCGYRFNSYIALAVAGMLYGAPGIATMGLIVGAAVPLANLLFAGIVGGCALVSFLLGGNVEMLVMQANQLAATADPLEITRTITAVAWQADKVEQKLGTGDQY